jgi:hypothetical protein
MARIADMVGKRFGALMVLSYAGSMFSGRASRAGFGFAPGTCGISFIKSGGHLRDHPVQRSSKGHQMMSKREIIDIAASRVVAVYASYAAHQFTQNEAFIRLMPVFDDYDFRQRDIDAAMALAAVMFAGDTSKNVIMFRRAQ